MLKYHKIVACSFCGKSFYKYAGHIKENLKLGHNFYCSLKCQYKYKTKRKALACENCGKQFLRALNDISPHNYCSHSCTMIINNKKYSRIRLKPVLKTCVKCDKQFRKSTGNSKYCSMKCRGGAKPKHTLQELIDIIKAKTQELGRVPARREIKESDACRKFFGSWNNAIIAADLQPNRSHSQRMYKRTNTVSSDGHLCDSVSELLVDNWLAKNNIPHKRDISYPTTNHKADWAILIGNQKIFVEYFGLANDSPRYDRAIKEKKKLCHKNKISLISVYPKDLYPKINFEDNLKEKFKKFSE